MRWNCRMLSLASWEEPMKRTVVGIALLRAACAASTALARTDSRVIEVDCNTAIDSGLDTFTFAKTGAVVKARYTYTYR
jgi:hypothetical protein